MSDVTRRGFVQTSAGAAMAAAPAFLAAQNTNNKIRVGWIGVGGRGAYCLKAMLESNPNSVVNTAVCDTYTGNMNKGKDIVQTVSGNTPKTYLDYKDMLADPDIDAIVIMTPEHLHYPMMMDGLRAKKHIYVEKPLSHLVEEGFEILDLAEKTDVVTQVGTQNRSNKLYQAAKDLIGEGKIGDVHYVRAFWYRNFTEKQTYAPRPWRYIIPDDTDPSNTDFKRFLGDAPDRPFSKERYFQWRNYWDYSSGISTDLLVHQTDITNFILNNPLPTQCMASGGIYRWNDGREVPDTISAIYEYPNKFHLNYSSYFGNKYFDYGEQFFGDFGTIEVIGRKKLRYYPEDFGASNPERLKGLKPMELDYIKDFSQPDATHAHFVNWVEAIQGKAKAIAPVSVGQEAAIPGHMATQSYLEGKKCTWDAQNRKFLFT
jgi:predicted dehydrogenase